MFGVAKNERTMVDDILFEKDVASVSPRGDDGSAVRIISANTSCSGVIPLASRASFIIWPPFCVSLVSTQAFRSGKSAAMPIGSCSSKNSTWMLGASLSRNYFTFSRRSSYGSMYEAYAFLVRSVSEVTPQWRTFRVTRHAYVRRSRWPRCMWSNVPPMQTVSYRKRFDPALISVSCNSDIRLDPCLTMRLGSFCSWLLAVDCCSVMDSSMTPMAGLSSSTAIPRASYLI